MITWAMVPVKPLRRGKSRLSEILTPVQRMELNRYLLTHTLEVLRQIPEIEHTLVISRDPEALAIARRHGARTVTESRPSNLNLALQRASILAEQSRTPAVLIVPSDLPALGVADIEALLTAATASPALVIAPDFREDGTNALLVHPPHWLQFSFGPQSFLRHCQQAQQVNAQLHVIRRPGLMYDLDRKEDFFHLAEYLPSQLVQPLTQENSR